MIQLASATDQAIVEEALRSANPAALTEWEFWAGSKNLDNRAESLSYGREGDSTARALDSDLSGALNPGIRGEDVAVDIIVRGVPIRRFTGKAHRPVNSGFRSKLIANTAGWWATGESAVKLGRERRFSGYTPKRAAEEQLFRLPYPGDVDVQETTQETFLRGVAEPFEKTEEVGAVLAAVTDETNLVFTDTRLNGVQGRIPKPTALSGSAVWTFRVGQDCDTEAFSYSGEVKEYRDVQAVRTREDGTTEDLTELVEIPGSNAPEGATYYIQIETEGPEAYTEGIEKVNEAVTNLVHGETPGTLDLPFIHALLEEGDVVEVLEPTEDETDDILRRWLCRVDLIGEDAFDKTQSLEWTGTYREARLPKPERIVPPGSGAIVRPPYGLDYLGDLYFEVSWAYLDEEGYIRFTEEAPVTQDSEGFYVVARD